MFIDLIGCTVYEGAPDQGPGFCLMVKKGKVQTCGSEEKSDTAPALFGASPLRPPVNMQADVATCFFANFFGVFHAHDGWSS